MILGTPLQVLQFNRVKNPGSNRSAKSIGDSIKRHIFSKSIISRTPKRPANSSPAFDVSLFTNIFSVCLHIEKNVP